MKKISILGSTGSIGTQALDVIAKNCSKFEVVALSCAKSVDLLCKQIEKFSPEAVAVEKEEDALMLQRKYPKIEVFYGKEGLNSIAAMDGCDMVLNSLMGMRGLEPTIAALKNRKDIAFANKETLVAGGELVMNAVKEYGVRILPVDSEHSAIFQSMRGNERNRVKRILLTASGGPFRGYSRKQLENVTAEQALKHPKWSMGNKITIDSATMMNKGLEVIEAKWLFDVPLENIEVVVHPQSILHSAVEYEDGSVIGQMCRPDMRIPIAYAFSYPERINMTYDGSDLQRLDFFSLNEGMSFFPVDREVFKTVDLSYEACRRGGSYPVVLNSANEVLVDAFLKGIIKFTDIQDLLVRLMEEHNPQYGLTLEEIIEMDLRIRENVKNMI